MCFVIITWPPSRSRKANKHDGFPIAGSRHGDVWTGQPGTVVLEQPLALRLGVRGFCSVPPWGPGTFYSPSRTRHSGRWGVRSPRSFAFCPNPSWPRPATAQALLPPGATSFPPPGSARGTRPAVCWSQCPSAWHLSGWLLPALWAPPGQGAAASAPGPAPCILEPGLGGPADPAA